MEYSKEKENIVDNSDVTRGVPIKTATLKITLETYEDGGVNFKKEIDKLNSFEYIGIITELWNGIRRWHE